MWVAGYNPLSTQGEGRLEDISIEFKNVDAIIVYDTGRRDWKGDNQAEWVSGLRHHWGLSWVYAQNGSMSNSSCGITILLKIANFQRKPMYG